MKNKSIRHLFIAIVSLPLFLLIIFLLWIASMLIAENNFAGQLKQSLPIKTTLIKTQASSHQLSGSGDRIDYLAIALIESELSKEQLEEYYQCYSFEYAKLSRRNAEQPRNKVRVQVDKLESLPVETKFSDDGWDVFYFEDFELNSFENMYFVVICDDYYSFWE